MCAYIYILFFQWSNEGKKKKYFKMEWINSDFAFR